MKLDIACGQNKQPGFVGIDLVGADLTHDLFTFPWPIIDGAVSEVYCSHFVEHIPHWRPGWQKDGWWLFWEEVARICEPGAPVTVVHPYLKSVRAFQDPTHTRFIPAESWQYLSLDWRKAQGLDHYDTTAHFDTVRIRSRGRGTLNANLWDSIEDLEVDLRRR